MADAEIVPEVAPVAEVVPAQEELPLVVAGETPAEETSPEPGAEAVAETLPEPVVEPEPAKPEWWKKELGKKHAQIKDAERKLAEKDAQIEALRVIAERQPAVDGEPVVTQPRAAPVESQDIVERRVRAQIQYDDDCNKAAQNGEKEYGAEWRGAIENLQTLGGFDPETMTGVLATDNPAKVLYELGKNPENYQRIMELPPAKRIIEMGKLAMAPVTAKKVSDAPAPVAAVGGRAAPAAVTLNDKMSDDEWYAAAQAQRRAKWEANNRPRR